MFKSKKLNEILQFELEHGNEIVENTDWLPKCEKLIILQNRFIKKFDLDGIKYRELNDSHYWFSQYGTDNSNECLACR